MIVDSSDGALTALRQAKQKTRVPAFKRALMVSPEHFKVAYAINPFMRDSEGNFNKVDESRARVQWESLREAYQVLGVQVTALPGQPSLPDMVFTANQSFPFWDFRQNRPGVVLSRMRSDFRKPEVSYFRQWYEDSGYTIHEIPAAFCFEGNGDAFFHASLPVIWGGYGPRTDKTVYDRLHEITGLSVIRLKLTTETYYHLDTCLSILDEDTAVIAPSAFDDEGRKILEVCFKNLIRVDEWENLKYFCANCHCPDGKHVLFQKGSVVFQKQISSHGFIPVPVDTSEFIKSGGSVFCLKMMVF